MRRWILGLALLLVLPCADALAATCTASTGTSTWSGSSCNGGTIACDEGGSPACADDVVIQSGADVTIDANLGTSASIFTGTVTVQSGGSLNVDCNVVIHANNLWLFEDDSDGDWNCEPGVTFPLPNSIVFPDDDTIRLDFSEFLDEDGDGDVDASDNGSLPFAICNAAATTGIDCDETTIHADGGSNDEPATWIRLDWSKFRTSPEFARLLSRDGRLSQNPVYSPGILLEVEAVSVANNTVDLAMPQLGPNDGVRHFGTPANWVGGNEGTLTTNFGSRCNECITDPNDGTPADDDDDTSGERLRNSIGEAQWTVDDVGLFANSTTGGYRYEIRIAEDDDPFDSDREFIGALVCNGEAEPDGEGDTSSAAPTAANFADHCFRVWDSYVDAYDASGAGDATEDDEILVVAKDPRGVLRSGDQLNVYMIKPTPGDSATIINPIRIEGHRSWIMRAEEGSLLGHTDDFRGVTVHGPGPNYNASLTDAQDTTTYDKGEGTAELNAGLIFANGTEPGLRIRDSWVYHQGGEGTLGASNLMDDTHPQLFCLLLSAEWSDASDASQTFSDVLVDGFWCGFPDAKIDLASSYGAGNDEPVIQIGGISHETKAGTPPNEWRAGRGEGDAYWDNVRYRKIRTDGFTGISAASGATLINCEDGLWLQHGLFVNNLNGQEKVADIGNEVFEHAGTTGTCGSDRWVVTTATVGSPTILRAMGAKNGENVLFTNAIVTGGNDNNNAVTSNPHSGNASSTDGESDDSTNARVTLANAVVRQNLSASMQLWWSSHIGHFTAAHFDPVSTDPDLSDSGSMIPGYSLCWDSYGLWTIGQNGAGSITSTFVGDPVLGSGVDGCASNPEVEIREWTALNYQGSGILLNQSNTLNGDNESDECGPAEDQECTAPQKIIFDGFLVENQSTDRTFQFLSTTNQNEAVKYSLTMNNGTILAPNETGSEFLLVGDAWDVNKPGLAIGPNLWFSPDGSTPCDEGSGITAWADTAECVPEDEDALGGDGSIYGTVDEGEVVGSRAENPYIPGMVPSMVLEEGNSLPSRCDGGLCDPETALPQWSGPIVESWVFGWATVDPVWGYRRTEPKWEYVPARLISQLKSSIPSATIGCPHPGCPFPGN